MSIGEIKSAFSTYLNEIDNCENAQCYWALLHLLLVIPDVCSSLEKPSSYVGDRYVKWCEENMPDTTNIKASDRYQMRNSLLHAGSSTVNNKGKHVSAYCHFSFVDRKTMSIDFHDEILSNVVDEKRTESIFSSHFFNKISIFAKNSLNNFRDQSVALHFLPGFLCFTA